MVCVKGGCKVGYVHVTRFWEVKDEREKGKREPLLYDCMTSMRLTHTV